MRVRWRGDGGWWGWGVCGEAVTGSLALHTFFSERRLDDTQFFCALALSLGGSREAGVGEDGVAFTMIGGREMAAYLLPHPLLTPLTVQAMLAGTSWPVSASSRNGFGL